MNDIKFEIINGKLCQMVEQPCPHCGQPEIIATPVVEGSREWASYQMMQGKSIGINDQPNRCLRLVDGYIQDSIRDGYWNGKSLVDFISRATSCDWQIYEPEPKPKPLLADANVGDLVKLETGKWHKIKAIVQQHESCLDFLVYGLDNGIHYAPNGNGMRTDSLRIVEWQPIASKGTAEWAWQMNKLLGKKVMHPHSNCITDGNIMSKHKDIFLAVTFPTGWQLYEPEPEFKVGDCRIEFVKKELYNLLDKL